MNEDLRDALIGLLASFFIFGGILLLCKVQQGTWYASRAARPANPTDCAAAYP